MSEDDVVTRLPSRVDGILDALPDGLVVADGEGRIEFVNVRAARLLDCPVEALLGRDVVDALPLLDGAGHSWWRCVDPWGGLAIRTGHRERMLLVPGRGQLLVTMRYVRERRLGPVTRVLVSLRDTDARRRAEAENAELISLVAHELRAPLASVKGFSTTLLRRWERFTDDQKHLMIETIEADADRLARLIHELLDVSRLDTSRLRLDRRRVDLRAAIGHGIDRLIASGLDAERFQVTVETPTGPEGDVVAWADADRLDQIVTNLLENAVRHGAGRVYVHLSPDPAGRQPAGAPFWAVAVCDEGEGVRPEHHSLVFGKFWHGSRRGSTGLGLYLVRGLVEAHGGVITVDRASTGGAEFRFTLPMAPEI